MDLIILETLLFEEGANRMKSVRSFLQWSHNCKSSSPLRTLVEKGRCVHFENKVLLFIFRVVSLLVDLIGTGIRLLIHAVFLPCL